MPNKVAPFEIYANIKTSEIPDFNRAIFDFIKQFTNIENVFQGNQNRAYLPKDSNDLAIFTPLTVERVGTNHKEFNKETDLYTTKIMLKLGVQLDIYGNNQAMAMQNMTNIIAMWRDNVGCSFLDPYNVSPLYADDFKDLTGVDKSSQYVARYMTTLYFTVWASLEMNVQTTSTIEPQIIAVDTIKGDQ